MALPYELLQAVPAPDAASRVTRTTQPTDVVAALLANRPPPPLPSPVNPVASSNIDWVPHKRRVAEPEHKLVTAAERYPDEQLRFFAPAPHASGRGHVSPERATTLNSGQMAATLNPLAPVPPSGLSTFGPYKVGPMHGDPHVNVLARQAAHKDSIKALIAGAAPAEPASALRRKAPIHTRISEPGLAGAPYGLTGVNTPAFSPSKSREDGLAFGRGSKGTVAGRGRYNGSTLRSDNVAALILEAGGGGSGGDAAAAAAAASPAPPVFFPPDERGTEYSPHKTTPLGKPTDKGTFGWGGGSHGRGGGPEFRERRFANTMRSDGVASLLRPSTAAADAPGAASTPSSERRAAAGASPALLRSTAAAAFVPPSEQVRPATVHTSRRHAISAVNDPYKPTSIY